MITRPPPPSGPPPVYAVAGRAFGRTNLRPVVIATTIPAIIWSLVWGVQAFEDIGGDKANNDLKKLVIFDIVLGALYSTVAAIEFFGLFAAITRRTPLARMFAGLSFLAVALVSSAEIIRVAVHFAFKHSLIDECITESTGKTVRTSFGFWGGSTTKLSPDDAAEFCNNGYSHLTFSTIAWLFVVTLMGLFFASVAYSFYRQLLDPNAFRAARAPSDQVRLDALRYQRDQQAYGRGYVPYPGVNDEPTYAPPPGPPPGLGYGAPPYESGRLPGYGSEFPAKDVGDEKGEHRAAAADESAHHTARPDETDLNQHV